MTAALYLTAQDLTRSDLYVRIQATVWCFGQQCANKAGASSRCVSVSARNDPPVKEFNLMSKWDKDNGVLYLNFIDGSTAAGTA